MTATITGIAKSFRFHWYRDTSDIVTGVAASVILDQIVGGLGENPAADHAYAFLQEDRKKSEEIVVRAMTWAMMDRIPQAQPSRVLSTWTKSSIDGYEAWHQIFVSSPTNDRKRVNFEWRISLVKNKRS